MHVNIATTFIVSLMAVYGGFVLSGNKAAIQWIPGVPNYDAHGAVALPANQIESIFIALNQQVIPVMVERDGNGGALASYNDELLVMTHEGGFFDVTGDSAIKLNIAPPENGWDDMLAFESANPDYTFANYYFRYNDVETYQDNLLVSFTEWVSDEDCYRTTLSRASLGGADTISSAVIVPSDWQILFSTTPCLPPNPRFNAIDGHMAGGRFVIDDDGMLYLASGDYGVRSPEWDAPIAQDPEKDYGKVIAIDLETGATNIVSQGHSNIQGITVDASGQLYGVEHGRRGGDELNKIVAGNDYGWPQVSLGTRYDRLPLPNTLEYGRHPYFDDPVYAWLPSVAVSSLTYIDGFHPAWDGDLIAGSLRAASLYRIRIRDDRVMFSERVFIGDRVRDIRQHGEKLIAWTDAREVIKLSPGEFDTSSEIALDTIAELDLTQAQKDRTEIALSGCTQCHSLGPTPNGNVPALGRVFGADIAAQAGFTYSDGLLATSGNWTRDRLAAFLANPDAFAPGTSMPNPQIENPVIMDALIDVLQAVRSDVE